MRFRDAVNRCFAFLLAVALIIGFMPVYNVEAASATAIKKIAIKNGKKTVTKKKITLQEDKKVTLKVSVTPSKAKKKVSIIQETVNGILPKFPSYVPVFICI